MNKAECPIGIVGLGRMGANMARRLKDQGMVLSRLYDLRSAMAEELAEELQTKAATTLSEVSAESSVVLTIVSDDLAMRQIFTGSPDNLLIEGAGRTFINFATVSPHLHLEIAAIAQTVGASTVEACMASSITQARNGALFLILGGEKAIVDRLSPILTALSSDCRYVGGTGRAAQVKALVNMVMNINTAGLAEGLGVGEALGLDLDVLREIFSRTGANSRVLETDGADMQQREHECYFSAAHAAKDSGIAWELAQQAGVRVPLTEAALGQYRLMTQKGLGELDKSGVAELTFKGRSTSPEGSILRSGEA